MLNLKPISCFSIALLLYSIAFPQTFEPKEILETREFPAAASADINGDEYLDLIIFNRRFSEPQPGKMYINDQDGGFVYADSLVGADGTFENFAGQLDFDQDGTMDLITRKHWYQGLGNGSFQQIAYEQFASCLSIGDLNQDSLPDLLVIKEGTPFTPEPDSIMVFFSLYPNGYEVQLLEIDENLFGFPRRAKIVDFNQNGQNEILFDWQSSQRQIFFLGDNGSLVKKDASINGALYGDLSFADFDQDGDLDIFYNGEGSFSDPEWFIFEDSTFSSSNRYPISSDNLPLPIDLNGDLYIDYLAGLSFSGSGFRTSDSLGQLSSITLISEFDRGLFHAFDWDNDGDQDLVFSTLREGVQLIENTTVSDSSELVSQLPWINPQEGWGQIYPNPTHANLTIDTGKEEVFSVRIFNRLFQLVRSIHRVPSGSSIKIVDLPPGTYHIHLIGSSTQRLSTFIKR